MRYSGQNRIPDVARIMTPAITAVIVAMLDVKIAHPVMKGAASKKMLMIMRIARSILPIFAVISMSPVEVAFRVYLSDSRVGDIVTKWWNHSGVVIC